MIARPPTSTPFPTRRSSDLRKNLLLLLQLIAAALIILAFAAPFLRLFALGGRSIVLVVDTSASMSASDLRDRKSTRLNSSHTVISYAVFCLKKKRTTLEETP